MFIITYSLSAQTPYTIGEYWKYKHCDIIQTFKRLPLTKHNVALAIKATGIQHPLIVFKQAIYESGHLKSNLAVIGNNLFAMKKANGRPCYALKDTYHGYAVFYHWIYSICDYKLWQNCQVIKGDYYSYLLKRNYAVDENYIKRLKSIKITKNIRKILE